VLNEARFTTAGRAFDQHRQLVIEGVLKKFYFAALGAVKRMFSLICIRLD
jgi:hypothetical protein